MIRANLFWYAIIIAISSTVSVATAHAQVETLVPVGNQPLGVYALGDRIHILCNTYDANFNGIQDAGDLPASWYVINATTHQVVQQKTFEWGGVGFPIRPGIDYTDGVLYLPHLGRVRAFSMTSLNLVDDTVVTVRPAAISVVPGAETLLLSVREEAGSSVWSYHLDQGKLGTRAAFAFVQQTMPFQTSKGVPGFAILSEGVFGSGESKLQIITPDHTPVETVLEIGDTGNHLFLNGDELVVTVNGSHQVHIVDLNNRSLTRTISTRTSGTGGPREAVTLGSDLYVTTYSNDVRRFDYFTGEMVRSYNPGGRPEGIAVAGGKLFVANAYLKGTYSPSTSVAVIDPDVVADVNSASQSGFSARIFPQPVRDRAEVVIDCSDREYDVAFLELVTVRGTVAAPPQTLSLSGATTRMSLSVQALGLRPGVYYVRISRNETTVTIPMIVVR